MCGDLLNRHWMTENERLEPTKVGKQRPSWRSRMITKALLGLGVLQVYNIVSHRQSLIDLSQSVQLMAAWWRYLISLPFEWLHLDLTLLQRETLALLVFVLGAAGLGWKRVSGQSLLVTYARYYRPASWQHDKTNNLRAWRDLPDPDTYSKSMRKIIFNRNNRYFASMVSYIAMGAALLAMLAPFALELNGTNILTFYIVFGIPLVLFLVLVIVSSAINGALQAAQGEAKRKQLERLADRFMWTALMMLTPIIIPVLTIKVILAFSDTIIWSLRWLIVVLIADLAARYAFDPYLASLPAIPMPPAF